MALTYREVNLVKSTIPALREHGEHIATVFYKTMLKEHHELHNFFNPVNMSNGAQPRALTGLILAFASNISHISDLVPKLERVANKHASLGIQPQHYDIVGKYLLRAFAAVLGDEMTPEVRVAWAKAYWVMAKMLVGREAHIYRDFEGWTGWRRFMIAKKTPETAEGDIVSFEFKPVDGAPLPPFMPGQYVSLRVKVPGSSHTQIRQYSLSDKPRPDRYRITVRQNTGKYPAGTYSYDLSVPMMSPRSTHSRSSSMSTAVESVNESSRLGIVDFGNWKPGVISNLLIKDLMEGDVLELSHPVGDFYLDVKNDAHTTPLVLISAGVGVSPILSMLNTVVDQYSSRPVTWVQAARGSMPFEDHVKDLAKHAPLLRTTFLNTAMGNKDLAESSDSSSGFGYYLESLNPDDLYFDNGSTDYFICGPEKFMLDMSEYLKANGVPTTRVRYEFHSTGAFELREER